jgi:hypothetical protein
MLDRFRSILIDISRAKEEQADEVLTQIVAEMGTL